MTVDRDTYPGLAGKDAIALVEGTNDPQELLTIAELEGSRPDGGRKSVTDAIVKKVDKLRGDAPPALDPSARRPEVMSAEHTPPEEEIAKFLEQENETPPAEEPEVVTVRKDLLQTAIRNLSHTLVQVGDAETVVDQLVAEEEARAEAEEEAKKIEPESLQEAAELHSNYPGVIENPLPPNVIESSNVDTFAQEVDASHRNAALLRAEAAESNLSKTENAGQHAASSAAAEAGEVWPPVPDDPEELVAARDEETQAAADEQRNEALKGAKEVSEEDSTVGYSSAREIAGDDEELYDVLRVYSSPSNGVAVGSRVSRHDEAQDEIGVVISVDNLNPNHPLCEVAFPSETVWLPPNNLRYEGTLADVVS